MSSAYRGSKASVSSPLDLRKPKQEDIIVDFVSLTRPRSREQVERRIGGKDNDHFMDTKERTVDRLSW